MRRVLLGMVVGVTCCLLPAAPAAAVNVTVNLAGNGSGTVTSVPAGISCSNTGSPGSAGTGVCTFNFPQLSTVQLTAAPDAPFEFFGWTSLQGASTVGTCRAGNLSLTCTTGTLLVSAPNVTATFTLVDQTPAAEIDDLADADIGSDQATFHGSVDPNGSAVDACSFEYLTDAQYQANSPSNRFAGAQTLPCVPGPAGIGGDDDPVDVTATATGLAPNTAYRVRLVATKANAAPSTAADEAAPFTTDAVAPAPATGRAWSVTDGAATLAGTVNPRNTELVACEFQYVSQAQFEVDGFDSTATAPCSFIHNDAPSENLSDLPVDDQPHLVTASIGGLDHNAAYRFRLVASNGIDQAPGDATVEGDASAFETRTAFAGFPTRGYELVSAADTNGILALPDLASPSGDHLAYITKVPVPGSESGGGVAFVSSRNADGSWSQAYAGGSTPGVNEFGRLDPKPLYSADDLSRAAFGTTSPLDPDDQNETAASGPSSDAYLRDTRDGTLTWLSRDPSIPAGQPQVAAGHAREVQYVSDDGARVYFVSARRLLPEAIAGAPSLYEWDEGRLSLVSVQPGLSTGFVSASTLASPGLLAGLPAEGATKQNAVSVDGRRVVFSSGDRLYVRIDGEHTVEASAGLDPTPSKVVYVGADRDTRSVFFTSASKLTTDSGIVTEGAASDLYRYTVPPDGDPANGRLVDLTPHPGGAGIDNVSSQTVSILRAVAAVSDDGRRVYFFTGKALTSEAQPFSQCGQDLDPDPVNDPLGTCNLYLAEIDGPDDNVKLNLITAAEFRQSSSARIAGSAMNTKGVELATNADGSMLAFLSRDPLVPGRRTSGLAQVYVYETDRDELSCASCPPDGSSPPSSASLSPSIGAQTYHQWTADVVNATAAHVRNVTAHGSVFFQTSTALLDEDVGGIQSVYEWRDGHHDLISSVNDPGTASFGDASNDGSTVFFSSPSNVYVAGDNSGSRSIYAARIGGGFESLPAESGCTGEDCRASGGRQPGFATPATGAVAGHGNVVDPPRARKRPIRQCATGKIRRGRRCFTKRALARRVCAKHSGRIRQRCVKRQLARMGRTANYKPRRAAR